MYQICMFICSYPPSPRLLFDYNPLAFADPSEVEVLELDCKHPPSLAVLYCRPQYCRGHHCRRIVASGSSIGGRDLCCIAPPQLSATSDEAEVAS